VARSRLPRYTAERSSRPFGKPTADPGRRRPGARLLANLDLLLPAVKARICRTPAQTVASRRRNSGRPRSVGRRPRCGRRPAATSSRQRRHPLSQAIAVDNAIDHLRVGTKRAVSARASRGSRRAMVSVRCTTLVGAPAGSRSAGATGGLEHPRHLPFRNKALPVPSTGDSVSASFRARPRRSAISVTAPPSAGWRLGWGGG